MSNIYEEHCGHRKDNWWKYSRKRVTHYAYRVTNYDSQGTVYVNLLVWRNRIIAADISSLDDGGFISPLTDFDTSKLK